LLAKVDLILEINQIYEVNDINRLSEIIANVIYKESGIPQDKMERKFLRIFPDHGLFRFYDPGNWRSSVFKKWETLIMKLSCKLFLNLIMNAGLLILISVLQADANRGVRVQLREDDQPTSPIVEEVQLYGASHALVIGIDNYSQGWPRLSNAVRDAELVADELREKGFDVTLEKNLDSADLERTFKEFFVLKGSDPQARLFVWFAGHGYSQDGEGYLIPADAPLPNAGAKFLLKVLSMRRFGEYVRLALAKHAFAVFDACFSGTIFSTQRSIPPTAVTRATTLPVRQFLSSGDKDQEVSDDGRFCKLFIRALRGEEKADANGDGYLTGSELGMFLTDRVTNLTVSRQTPRYGKLRDENYDRGDFVFLLAGSGKDHPYVVTEPEITNPIGMTFKLIPAGTFMMGSKLGPEEVVQKYGGEAKWFKREHPQHSVKITKPFYIQTTEVTQDQWQKVMGNNPSYFKECGDDCPVESVSWDDAQKFIAKLNKMEGTDQYRLPSEAEWEYACRAGTTTSFYSGDSIEDLKRAGWYAGNSENRSHSVGAKKENKFGLYDMHGNVWEWVEDDEHVTYEGAPADGSAWINKNRSAGRVFRGGTWGDGAWSCRSAFRPATSPGDRVSGLGFRLARFGAPGS
jgi:formylglycine-generating enzyme required for sulfatase activity